MTTMQAALAFIYCSESLKDVTTEDIGAADGLYTHYLRSTWLEVFTPLLMPRELISGCQKAGLPA